MMVLKQAKFPAAKKESVPVKWPPSSASVKASRPLLQSINSPALLERERTRAVLINQLYKPPDSMQREFSSYYLSDNTAKPKGSYLLTSHENPTAIRPPVISTYNMVKDFQWDPYRESTKIVAYQETGVSVGEDLREFQDHAERAARHESSKNYSSFVASNPRVSFKDNIMQFRDGGTQTRILNDASCCTPAPVSYTPYMSNAVVSTTHIEIQDSLEDVSLQSYPMPQAYVPPQRQPMKDYPPPILKKTRNPSYSYSVKYDKCEPRTDMDAERDVAESRSYPADNKSNPTPSKRSGCYKTSAKVLYNEGIDDSMMEYNHLPMRKMAPSNASYDRNKVAVGRYYNHAETDIPYSHRSDSKYHSSCMDPLPRRYIRDDSRKDFPTSSISRTFQNASHFHQYKLPSGPKRVLDSDQDIDMFVEINQPKLVVPNRNKQ